MNVLMISPFWQIGGVERTNMKWVDVLNKEGNHCTILTIKGENNFPNNTNLLDFLNVKDYSKARTYLRRNSTKFDKILFIQSFHLPHFVTLISWIFLTKNLNKVFICERNTWAQYKNYHLKKHLLATLLVSMRFLGAKFIVNSETIKNSNKSIFAGAHVYTNPRFNELDIKYLKSISPKEVKKIKRVVFIGRWSDQKDTDFIKFAEKIISKDIEFLAFCDQNELDYQRPFLENVLKYLYQEDVCIIHCSKFEGFPNILLEARACNVPIIYFDSGSGEKEICADYNLALPFKKDDFEYHWKSILGHLKTLSYIKKPQIDFAYKHSTLSNTNLLDYLN